MLEESIGFQKYCEGFLYLLRLKIIYDGTHCTQNFIDESTNFVGLYCDEMSSAFDSDFNECVASHILNTIVGFVHKLEQFIHNGL